MIPREKIGPFDQIYTWVRDDGVNINISTSHIVEWSKTVILERHLLPIELEMVHKFKLENAIKRERILQMMVKPPIDPIIMCLTGRHNINGIPGPEGMLVDGRHRYSLYAMLGIPMIPVYVLKRSDWMRFRISGMPKVTKQQLQDRPVYNHILNKD